MKKTIAALIASGALLLSAVPALATQVNDSVTITEKELACGKQEVIFEGTATYEDNDQHLVVTLTLNGTLLNSNSEPTTWSTTPVTLDPGTYTLNAKINESDPPQQGDPEASDSWTFTIPECPNDVCPNIEGIQETLPDDKILEEGNCVDVPTPIATPSATPKGGEPTELPNTGQNLWFLLVGLIGLAGFGWAVRDWHKEHGKSTTTE